jgi:glycosyltransferase involved in cell wall biosynthesis
MPWLSIVLPVYNVGAYVERCIESCLAQDNGDFEMVFVDDCGQDDSMRIVGCYAAQDKRIKIVSNPRNEGTFHSRRAGTFAACGDYVFFLDPDDALPVGSLSRLLDALDRAEGSGDLILSRIEVRPKNRWISTRIVLPDSCRYPEILPQLFLGRSHFNLGTPGKVYRRRLLLDAYDFLSSVTERLVFAEDVLLLFVCAVLAERLSVVDDVLYLFHVNPISATQGQDSPGILRNIAQIDLVINKLDGLQDVRGLRSREHFAEARNEIVNRLERDKLMLMRHLDPSQYSYDKLVYRAFQRDGNFRHLVRIAMYHLSLHQVRL